MEVRILNMEFHDDLFGLPSTVTNHTNSLAVPDGPVLFSLSLSSHFELRKKISQQSNVKNISCLFDALFEGLVELSKIF